jgi:glutathione peroxidase-family protein
MNFFNMPGVMIDGKKVNRMGQLCKGKKAVMVVNVASQCTLTE